MPHRYHRGEKAVKGRVYDEMERRVSDSAREAFRANYKSSLTTIAAIKIIERGATELSFEDKETLEQIARRALKVGHKNKERNSKK